MAKLNFQQLLLQSSVSHDPSDIIHMLIGTKKPLLLLLPTVDYYLLVKNVSFFVETMSFFSGFSAE